MIRQLREFLDSHGIKYAVLPHSHAVTATELLRMDYRDFERLVRPKVLRFGTRV